MGDPSPIYTITVVRFATFQNHRSVGFFYTFEDADRAVRQNMGDMNEDGHYIFAVIEPVREGIYVLPRKETWYKFNNEKKEYEPCEKPNRFKCIAGWSLG